MKKIFYLIVDLMIIYGSIVLSFYLLGLYDLLENFQRNFQAFIVIMPYIGIWYLFLMYAFGLYNTILKKTSEILYVIFLLSLSLAAGITSMCFLIRDVAFAFPRSIIFISFCFYFLLLTVWHLGIWKISHHIYGIKKIIIIGNNQNKLIEAIQNKYKDFYHIKYICSDKDPELVSKIESVDKVFMSEDISQKKREYILPLCIKYEKEVYFIPKYFDLIVMASSFSKIDDIPTYLISNMVLPKEEVFIKRVIDMTVGIIASIIAFPIALFTAFLIKLDGGPVFYSQERFTRERKTFKILKFRTMVTNAEKHSGPVLAGKKDPRITKVGKYIRATRIDEIPQLINILKGEMSIVGPRPERPFFAEQFEKEIPEYRYRFKMKAGLTGLAQVEGKYNTSVEDKLRYDLIYINTYSILKDFLIMLQTVKILFLKSSTEGVNSE